MIETGERFDSYVSLLVGTGTVARPPEHESGLRVCIDGTMIRECRDSDHTGPLDGVIRQAKHRELPLVVSDLTVEELRDRPAEVGGFPRSCRLPNEFRSPPRSTYVERGLFKRMRYAGACHIAAAAVAGAGTPGTWTARYSWEREVEWDEVNRETGYGTVGIIDPRALDHGRSAPIRGSICRSSTPRTGFQGDAVAVCSSSSSPEEIKGMTGKEEHRWHTSKDRENDLSLTEWWTSRLSKTCHETRTAS